jgi:hypothetical protein
MMCSLFLRGTFRLKVIQENFPNSQNFLEKNYQIM